MKKGDKIVGIVLIIVVLLSFGGVSIYKTLLKGSENIAVIKREGKVIKTIDLNKVTGTQEFKLSTPNGNFNTILVEHNKISIKDANCPHQECVKSGSITKPGQMIVCLPYKFLISISGQSDNDIDSGAF
jgi:hypothetical protein